MPILRSALLALPLLACALIAPPVHAADPTIQGFGGGVVEANSIAADPDGNAYVLAAEGAPIAKVSPSGAKSSINFPDSIGPGIRLRGITYGPDGALWFSFNGLLTRVTQAGARTDFPIAMGARPAAGADGNLWFPETDTGMIARVTPAGLISRFPGASPGTISRLTLGPDGNLWYTNGTAGTIGRITEAGIITERPAPEGWFMDPGAPIASDGDDGLWVVLSDSIGHMDLTGHALGTFYVGLANVPSSIAPGADGNLWFVKLFVSAIGWITPAGQVHELTAPFVPYAQPSDVAAAGDGSLWATDFTNPSVWRIRPAQQSAATGAASAVRTDGATIAGVVNPRGTRTTVTFEYGPTSAYGTDTSEQDAGAGEDLTRLTTTLKGLEAATTYHYRVVTRSGVGTVRGDDETFTTLALPAVIKPKVEPHVDPPRTTPPTVTGTSEPPTKVVVPIPSLTLKPDARWERRGKAVVFTRLTLGALPAGARLTLSCRGGGCGFAPYTTVLRKATKSTNLLSRLQGSKLRRGAIVELRLTQDGHVGRVVRWTIGAPTRAKALCLAPTAKAPGACATP
jgi:virginiamycin B lyase